MAEAEVPDPIRAFPVVVTGRISQRGEVDTFWFEATAGQTLTFEGRSGHGSVDLSVGIFKAEPSWFDPNHMEQIEYNDEPLFFPGLSTDARVAHTFRKAGRYCVKVRVVLRSGERRRRLRTSNFSGSPAPPDAASEAEGERVGGAAIYQGVIA